MKGKHSQEGLENIKQSKIGDRNPMKRRGIRQKVSRSLTGRKLSDEHRKNIGLGGLGNTHGFKKGQTSWNKGISHGDKTKMKISKSKKGIMPSSNKILLAWIKRNGSPQKGKKYPIEDYPNYGIRKIRKELVLPKKDTKIEVKIQNFLKELGIEYFTHQYMKIEYGYQCDILIPSMNLIIECDGCYWHGCKICNLKKNKNIIEQIEKDKIRTQELTEQGFRVIRLWEHEIKAMDINDFKEKLEKHR